MECPTGQILSRLNVQNVQNLTEWSKKESGRACQVGGGKPWGAQQVSWLLSSPEDVQPVFHPCFIWFTLRSPSITDGNLKRSEKEWKESFFLAKSKHQPGTTQLQEKPRKRKSIVLMAHIAGCRVWQSHLANPPEWAGWQWAEGPNGHAGFYVRHLWHKCLSGWPWPPVKECCLVLWWHWEIDLCLLRKSSRRS